VSCEDNVEKIIHSLYDPRAEAKSIVDSFEFDGKGVLVVLGLGLGYHVAELVLRFPDAEILVIEAIPEIYQLAKEHGPAMDSKVRFVSGFAPDDVLRKITDLQMKKGFSPLAVFALSSAVSAFSGYYRPLLTKLQRTVSIKLWDRLKYSKFKRDKLKVVMIDTGYFLVKEVEKALISLDHEVLRVQAGKNGNGEINISSFIEAILMFEPDFLLTMNHLGFDEEGVLTEFFKSIEMPVASWYVDSPNLIVRAFEKNVSPLMSLFLWDRSYMSDMMSMGFESTQYLPLGTDETIFKPLTAKKHRKKLEKYYCEVGFVGNSMVEPVDEFTAKMSKEYHPLLERTAVNLAEVEGHYDRIDQIMGDDERLAVSRLGEKEKSDFEGAVIWKATLLYRLRCLEMLKEFNVSIHGDNAWRELLKGNNFKLHPPLNYYKELPFFYNACGINFNATSRQMKEAVNQRVFDVPACGAFLLTDHQDALNDLFDVGNEIITYRSRDEIADIAGYYLRHPEQRKTVARKGRERVMQEHTYKHRVKSLIKYMEQRYK
jgi:spore maturation protein CgeB